MQEINQKYHIKVVRDLDEFYKLESAWNGLLEGHKRHLPFLCFDWFRIWLKHFLKENKLFILLVYNEDRLVTIAPFIVITERFKGLITTKKIELIGNFHSYIRNVIFGNLSSEAKRNILGIIFDFLQSQYRDWDVIELDSIPEEEETINILNEIATKKGLRKREYFCYGDWYLDGINYSGDEYMMRRSKNTRSGVGKKTRRMEKLGHLEFEVGTEKEKLDYYLGIYKELRGKSWKYPETDEAFLNDSRRMAAEKQSLKFGFLFFNNSPIATLFAIISNGTAYLMEIVYDRQFEEFSPGEIIYAEFIKYLIDVDKITGIDQLRGDQPFKKSWTPQRRERRGILVFNRNLRGRFLSFLMTKILPVVEKNQYAVSLKNKLSGYLKKKPAEMMSD